MPSETAPYNTIEIIYATMPLLILNCLKGEL